MSDLNNDVVFSDGDDLYGKKINPAPKPEANIGIDTNHTIVSNIISEGTSSNIDMSSINSFTRASQDRNQLYTVLDTMSEDSLIASILETWAEDSTEYNDNGRIVWAESSNDNVNKYITYLIDTMNIDKHIYEWAYALCKYGDLYIRLFRHSDYDDELSVNTKADSEHLTEDVKIHHYSKNDKYVHYVEMTPNPAEVFELTRLGKSYAYIQAPTAVATKSDMASNIEWNYYKYSFQKSDIDIHSATDFVHMCLENNSNRCPEEVTIFLDDKDSSDSSVSYRVRRGQSLLYPLFKIWRELTLLENSILLNRVTKSSIVRLINVEVGDMPKEQVGPHLTRIKQLMEQKSAINTGSSMSEYTNPGPVENNVYIPTKNNMGSISVAQVGGDIDVKGLADLDYYRDKFFGAVGIPKMYFGYTSDGAGFNGGQSLSIISSRYAKTIKRIQNTLIQGVTDIINLMLLDKGLSSYIGKFTIKMLPPTTQEEIDRRASLTDRVNSISDIMNLLADIENPIIKLKILKSLISGTGAIQDGEIIELIQEEIDKLESELDESAVDTDSDSTFDSDEPSDFRGGGFDRPSTPTPDFDEPSDFEGPSADTGSDELPSPSDLGVDMTNNDIE